MDLKDVKKLSFGKKRLPDQPSEPEASAPDDETPKAKKRFSLSFSIRKSKPAPESDTGEQPAIQPVITKSKLSFSLSRVKKSKPDSEPAEDAAAPVMNDKTVMPVAGDKTAAPVADDKPDVKTKLAKIGKPSLEKLRKPKASKAGIAFKPTRNSKFVLFLGDEGAILVYIKGNKVESRQFAADAAEGSLGEFRETLAADPKAPLLMVVDSMDQTYVPLTLPPVSSMSVQKLVRKRLEREFGLDGIKGALLLGREKSGRKDWNAMMIAVERTPALSAWLDFIMELPHYFQGVCVVSTETPMLVRSIETAMGIPKEGTGAEWKFFVSHNKVGGFRQVIMRNNRIVFTRLAQPVGESNVEVIAGSIEQEIRNTIEYMSRLSFSPQAGLDIYIIASSVIKSLIDKSKFNASSLNILTPFEVAEYLHIEGATQPSDQFGDVILASAIGCTRKHNLLLVPPQFKVQRSYTQFIMTQRVVVGLAILGTVGYAASLGYDLYTLSEKQDELNTAKNSMQQQLNQLQAEIKTSNIDLEGASDLIEIYRKLEGKEFSPLPFLENLVPITQSPVWIKSVEWTLLDPPAGAATPSKLNSIITLEFPDAANDQKVFRLVARKLLDGFKVLYPGYDIKYSSLPAGFLENERLDIDLNADKAIISKDAPIKSMPEAKLSIDGPAIAPPPPKPAEPAKQQVPILPTPAAGSAP